jgi:hypothetical protein
MLSTISITRSKVLSVALIFSANIALANDGSPKVNGETEGLSRTTEISARNLQDQPETPLEVLSAYDAYFVNVIRSLPPLWPDYPAMRRCWICVLNI